MMRMFLKVINQVISKNMNGIFNIGGPKKISRYHLILECNKIFKKKVKLKDVHLTTWIFNRKASKNTSFDLKKLKNFLNLNLKVILMCQKLLLNIENQ